MHQSLDGTPARYTSVEEIATHYLREIRTVRPKGPYRLGGYCFGGMVAFEIAQQLQKQNERVDLVVLVDPSSPRSVQLPLPPSENAGGSEQTGGSSRDGTSFRDELSRHLQRMKALRSSQLPTYVLQRVKGKAVDSSLKIIRPIQKLAIRVYLGLGRPLPPSLRSQYILEVYFKAIRRYVPELYSGRLTIFKTDVKVAAALKWRALARGGADVHYFPGDHRSVLEEPHIQAWAEALKHSLTTQPDEGDAQ
jgi:thioesterase domain-containing protein